ncbi:hypothetical protein G6F57_005253 [Rhizopus arrhizus]|uniref:Uncharacterized protein n=1 Tax=Rhizopus oryzae TaxID=64495 RepID=A0A9P7BTQ9_RHIOR|nr:hypothetical protein G6F22_010981 [Rhizopus arrhizus]KAG1414747.1 hypothetical protein G6F58_006806 [Rhizopus delemar]KAG0794274.1 hypothetical protein G6F21_002984 [Rhizopus arrhizus]KAG0808103.1 hypothetical protein G6F20_009847 [Rhizopus arrhizus]KAG0833727.1 hypothetical protein G6F19_005546 [Rhizopus arrhizus]
MRSIQLSIHTSVMHDSFTQLATVALRAEQTLFTSSMKIMYNEQKWVEVKNVITALVCLFAQIRLRYQTEGLKALADTATSSRHILTFINIPADETNNLPIDDTTNNSPTDDTTNPLADDIIDDNDGFFSWCRWHLHC